MSQFLNNMAREDGLDEWGEDSEFGDSGSISDSIPDQGHSLSDYDEDDSHQKQTVGQKITATKRPAHSMTVELLLEIKRTNNLISSLTKKMKTHHSRLCSIESQLSVMSSSSSLETDSTPKRSTAKKNVPTEVRVSKICIYLQY